MKSRHYPLTASTLLAVLQQQDIVPVFDKREGAECSEFCFKTWSEMGLKWNQYCEYSTTIYHCRGEWDTHRALFELIQDCRDHGKRVIAAAINTCAVSVCVAA